MGAAQKEYRAMDANPELQLGQSAYTDWTAVSRG
jgi:hypothetical protein